MPVVIVIVANNYIIYPYLSIFTDKVRVLDLPDRLWQLMEIGVGGYILGRTAEKIKGGQSEATPFYFSCKVKQTPIGRPSGAFLRDISTFGISSSLDDIFRLRLSLILAFGI